MHKKQQSIPVHTLADGIAIAKASFEELQGFKEAQQSHRDEYHVFILQEKGSTSIEIDFQEHHIQAPAVVYIHPNQVHRMGMTANGMISLWLINEEHLNPGYRKLLQDIAPAQPLPLREETFSLIADAVALCIRCAERKEKKLYHALLRDQCNALTAMVIAQYLAQATPADRLSRAELITRAFRTSLEHHFLSLKKPADYARQLHLSVSYLNECVRNTTGHSVTHHIQQRILLEAKRLLYHSDRSVKEIAAELGYEDYPYFSRLFTRATGMTALSFRNKNPG